MVQIEQETIRELHLQLEAQAARILEFELLEQTASTIASPALVDVAIQVDHSVESTMEYWILRNECDRVQESLKAEEQVTLFSFTKSLFF